MAENNSKNQKLSAAFPNKVNEQTTNGLQICNVTNPAFDMTALLSAAQTYNRLNKALNQLIGMEVRWFRAVPQYRSQDVIFQEYTLSCVEEEPVCLKVVLPDGNFPDSKYNYDLMGLEYEVPLELHIDKAYWESMAGGGTAPQKKDIVYFAVPNKLYEVISSYLYRGFMEQETTWKVNLIKYQPTASRKEGAALKATIDQYTVSAEEIFGEKLESDIKKLSDDKQMSPFNSTEKDLYKVIDSSLNIIKSKLDIYGTVVAESFYDLSTPKYFNAVKYNSSDNISTTDDRSITAWVMIDPGVIPEYTVNSITPVSYPISSPVENANYAIKIAERINSNRIQVPIMGDNIEISRIGALNFYATVIDVSRNDQYGGWTFYTHIDETVTLHLDSIKSNWTEARNYKMRHVNPVNILDGVNNNYVNNIYDASSGFKFDILANQYLRIRYGTQTHIAVLDEKLNNQEWYGLVMNIGNTWGQYNTYIYRQHPSDVDSMLENIFYETIDFTPEETYIEYYTVNKSPSYLTNLRLYVSTIEEEKQVNELLRYFIKDGDQARIADNADLRLRAPFISQQR
jgi:hypothetical protein